MKTGIIADVSTIQANRKGEPINVVVIRMTNGEAIVRGLKQFVTDLTNSNRLLGINVDAVTSVLHPAIQNELPRLKNGGTVGGDFKAVKAGETYIDTNPQSPTFEQEKKYETDHIRVDGFLNLSPNNKYLQAELNADASARLMAELNGMFSFSTGASAGGSDAADDIPSEILNELTGNQSAMEESAANTPQ